MKNMNFLKFNIAISALVFAFSSMAFADEPLSSTELYGPAAFEQTSNKISLENANIVSDYDFNQMNEVVKNYTGSYTNLFRFPGGSSNTISRNYNVGVVTAIANEMTNRGYIYFDWNVSSGDASGLNSSGIYSRVVNGVESCSQCVVLMHDIKSTTANALDSILATLTSRGYTFLPLDANSPTAHHGINN